MHLIAPAAMGAASAVLLAASLTSPGVQPSPPAASPGSTVVMSAAGTAARAAALVVDREVGAGDLVKVTGRLSRKLAHARITLLRASGSSWKRQDVARADRRGSYAVKARAAATPGRYDYRITATTRRTSLTRSFSVRVSTGASIPDSTTPVPVPGGLPAAIPAPPTGGAGNPTDWTHISPSAPRWDPCQAITWSVAGASPYAGQVTDLTNAFALIGSRTGLTFIRVADPGASTLDVTWGTEAAYPQLAGLTLGFGGPTYTSTPTAGDEIISGRVVLDAGTELPAGFTSSGPTWGKVMVHEIMHAVGLGHAQGIAQMMYPMTTSTYRLGAGDLNGLYAVGAAQGCFPAVSGRTSPTGHTDLQR